ncbi:hypothetical protein [Engelhardtia mirabilis]|uniref:Phytase-like domain-containing protein n=1 Tax=Engelhardtia mirabilis TaxID=2528011 RepID=A0A518BMX0_9BACT|nr:hypothetical protein Pla133_34280 [Planctomycetes bacterium Pla133]QDV02658.1 hypothetical protein Pla86_34270 [Planctomycetes bacterium Pla86]
MRLSFAALALLTTTAAADWTLFQAPAGGVGAVIGVDDQGAIAAAPELADVALIALDFVGRTRIERFAADRPRHEPLPGGANRLVLPQGHGSLYAYRGGAGAQTHFGLFRVTPTGAPQLLLDLPGIGATGDAPPFSPRIACAPDGTAILIATEVGAGGDLLEIDLLTAVAENRSASLAPMDFELEGLALFSTWGVALDAGGANRFQRAPGAQLQTVAVEGATPAWFGGQVVGSGDGSTAGVLAGDGPDAARVATFGAIGTAKLASMPAQALDGAGFLPEAADGPWLVLSSDGTRVGYRTREPKLGGGLTREVWMAETVSGATAGHLTSDGNFLDTIDEVGLLRFVPGAGLMFGAGERNNTVPAGLDNVDLYLAQTAAGGTTTIVNLTLSSGDAVAPFLTPATLSPEDGLYRLPGTDSIVLHDGNGGGGRLLASVPPSTGTITLLADVKSLDAATWTGDRLVLSVRRDLKPKLEQLVSVAPANGLATLATLPEGTSLLGLSSAPDGSVGAIIDLGLSQWVARVNPAAGTGALLTPIPASWLPVIGWTSNSDLRVSLAPSFLPGVHVEWSVAGAIGIAPSPAIAGQLLPAL